MKLTAILALTAATALAGPNNRKMTAMKKMNMKRNTPKQKIMWSTGDAVPTAPGADCMTYDAYYYNDGGVCGWWEFDDWCGQVGGEICTYTNDWYSAVQNGETWVAPVTDVCITEQPAAPTAECFYGDAYYYTDGSACALAWDAFDQWCWYTECENTICSDTNYAYVEAQYALVLRKQPNTMQVTPDEECFYYEAFYYTDGSDCAEQWDHFDQSCWYDEDADNDLCMGVNDVFWAVHNYDGTIPGDECYYSDAYYYNEESACADQWNAFDDYCWTDVDANLDLCDAVNESYLDAATYLNLRKKTLVLAKAGQSAAASGDSFASGFVKGTLVGAATAALGVFAVKKCASKQDDGFTRY